MLRRKKSSVDYLGRNIMPLPKSHIISISIDFTKDERKIYDLLISELKRRFNMLKAKNIVNKKFIHIFTCITYLRQICVSP